MIAGVVGPSIKQTNDIKYHNPFDLSQNQSFLNRSLLLGPVQTLQRSVALPQFDQVFATKQDITNSSFSSFNLFHSYNPMMSCLPEIFQGTKSQSLPSKQAAAFSIHLRTTHFQTKPELPLSPRKNALSSQQKRYQSWMDTERPFRSTRRSSRSYFYKEESSKEKVLEERGHSCENINGQQTLQSELEAISSFNATKKNAVESMHIMNKSLEVLGAEENRIKEELSQLKECLVSDLDQFSERVGGQLTGVLKAFRSEKRVGMREGKAISAQLQYLSSQLGTCSGLACEVENLLQKMTSQFY